MEAFEPDDVEFKGSTTQTNSNPFSRMGTMNKETKQHNIEFLK
jgi:hypothetical protein